jgi:lantibiotic modifying enzyme
VPVASSAYLPAAERTGQWLIAAADRRPQGWCWPWRPGLTTAFGPGLGWGTAGPVMFFAEAFATTGDQRWLDAAKHGARWMAASLDDVAAGWAGCGLFTGIAGWAVALDLIAEMSDHDGDWLLGAAETAPDGIRWGLGDGAYATGRYNPRIRYPNFAHGTAGIAFFLARLAQQTGERRFLDASLAGTGWVLTTLRTDDDTCAAFHHEPDATGLFTLGWCHGPPGLGWLFRQLELSTGDRTWRTWLRRAARTDTASGIPARKEPGFWDNVARCCGSAGVAEFYLDLHRLEGDPADLEFARLMVDDLLGRAITDVAGTRWSNYEFRAAEPDLPPETGYLQGAPGIGSTLLRLHRHLSGDPWTVRWPHAPSWA